MISLCANRNNPEFLRQIISRRFDGVIISSISFPEVYIRQLADAGIPTVALLTRNYAGLEAVGQIDTGLYSGARDAVSLLAGQGRRRIIYVDRISRNGHFSDLSDARYLGYLHEMQANGLETQASIITGCTDEQELLEKLHAYFQTSDVDGILGRNDHIACLAMQEAIRMGRRVPDDVGVIGFDDSSICRLLRPSLTSVQLQEENIAQAAINLLYQIQRGSEIPPPLYFPSRLIMRESTGKASSWQLGLQKPHG